MLEVEACTGRRRRTATAEVAETTTKRSLRRTINYFQQRHRLGPSFG